jgi:GNAT superfamily N-acetyltransferase
MSSPWSIEPFDRQRHDRSQFDCGVPALNDWLAMRISQFEKRDLARTYVIVKTGDAAIQGYYSLSTHSVAPETLPPEQAKGLPKIDVPALLIGQLAVQLSTQGQGLGELLLLNALSRAEFLSRSVGIRMVEVDALNDRAKQFYESYGFVPLSDSPRHLFLPLSVVRKLNLPLL